MRSRELEIQESQQEDWICLTLLGELDLASVPVLEDRLGELRRERQAVLIDLSRLEFMDSTGVRVMIESLASASADGWRFAIDEDLSSQVKRLFRLTNLDKFVGMRHREATPT
jgi:anti-sigma B factor antagonist